MTELLTLLRAAWPYLACIAIGAAAVGGVQELRIDALTSDHEAEIDRMHAEETKRQLGLAAAWRAEAERKAALADDIDRKRAAENLSLARQLQEKKNALAAVTFGRPCLGHAALGLLKQPAGARPGLDAMRPGSLPDGPAGPAADQADQAAAAGDDYATDTAVADWIADASSLYEQCRNRIRDIRCYTGGGCQ
jgi:hypothetical protein